MNDDGEPAYTAGSPILGQITSAGLYDVLVCVVRYYGGVKLGAGGLSKAYKEAAKGVLESSTVIRRKACLFNSVTIPVPSARRGYGFYLSKQIKSHLTTNGAGLHHGNSRFS